MQENLSLGFANNKGVEQPAHPHSVNSTFVILFFRILVKSVYQKINFLISQPKQMLWVLIRTVSMRWFF